MADTSIPLSVQPLKIPSAAEVMTLKDLALRSQERQFDLQTKERTLEGQNAISQIMEKYKQDPEGPVNTRSLAEIATVPVVGAETATKLSAFKTAQRETQVKQRSEQQAEVMRDVGTIVSDARSLREQGFRPEQVRQEVNKRILDRETERQKMGTYSVFEPGQRQNLVNYWTQQPLEEMEAHYIGLGGKIDKPEHVTASTSESPTGLGFYDSKTKKFQRDSEGKIVAAPPTLQATMANVQIPDEDKKYWAEVLRKGGTLPPGLARSGVGAKLVSEVMQEVPKGGTTPADLIANQSELKGINAGQRTIGTKQAQIEMAVTEAKNMAPLALQASNAVDRTKYPTLNAALLAAQKGTGDENVVRLGVATNSLINIYARAINPTGVATVSDKDHARELLAAAWSKGQYAAGVDQLMKELAAAQKSPAQVRGAMREAITGKKTEEEKPKNDWVERAMKANPGLSREEVEAEAKRRGKL